MPKHTSLTLESRYEKSKDLLSDGIRSVIRILRIGHFWLIIAPTHLYMGSRPKASLREQRGMKRLMCCCVDTGNSVSYEWNCSAQVRYARSYQKRKVAVIACSAERTTSEFKWPHGFI